MNFTNWRNSTHGMLDVDEFIASVLGPRRLALNWLLPLTSVYAVIFSTGLVGNACTCLVIAGNPYMQTATNCYLFNLAVADMLTLLCAMPLEMYSLWHQYPWQLGSWMCILRTVMAEATAYASILTIVTFSCEQYIAVCHPLHQTTRSKVTRAFRNIIIIWIVSFAAAAPYGLFTKVNYLSLGPDEEPLLESAWCGFPFNDPNREWETLMLCSTFLFFVVPMTLISVLYFRISITLHRARNMHRAETVSQNRTDGQRARIQSRRIVIRMLMTVVIAFFVCWAPYHSQRLFFLYVSLYGQWTESLRKINQDLFSLAGCLYYFNSTINPVLYSVMSNRFRVAFREKLCAGNPCTSFLCCCCCCWRWWRDHFQSHRSSSGSSSHRSPHANAAIPMPIPTHIQASLLTNLKDKNLPMKCNSGRLVGLSHSDDKIKDQNAKSKQMFSSDPNFSLRLAVIRCQDISGQDGSEMDISKQMVSTSAVNFERECVSCSNCNMVFPSRSVYKAVPHSSSSSEKQKIEESEF